MAKKVEGYIKLQIAAGKATPAPPVGPALGQHGVNIAQFTKEFSSGKEDVRSSWKECSVSGANLFWAAGAGSESSERECKNSYTGRTETA